MNNEVVKKCWLIVGCKKMSQSRAFCFTCPIHLGEPVWSDELMNYLVYRREVGQQTGLVHWQGYVEFRRKRLKTAVPKKLGVPGCHVEIRRGTAVQAAGYCKDPKEGADKEFKEFGVIECVERQRNDLESVYSAIRQGRRLVDVADEHPGVFMRFHRAMSARLAYVPPPFRDEVKVHFWWGLPGIGKSRKVFQELRAQYESGDVYVATDNVCGWMDGYAAQSIILFDDFKGLWPLGDMLRMLERNPARGWVKGGSVPICATTFYFTAERPPESFYLADAAWLRRVTNVVEMK